MRLKMASSDRDLNLLCRTCMNEVAQAVLYADDNTEPQLQSQSIYKKIEECGDLRITELISNAVPQIEMLFNDELPTKICCKCLQQLLSAYRFQQMCIQSELQLRVLVSKNQTSSNISLEEAVAVDEIGINASDSHQLEHLQFSSTSQDLQISAQEPLLVATEVVIEPEVADHLKKIDKLLEDCKDAQSEFIKNEPIEDDELNKENSDADTMFSTISVKDELLSVESEEQLSETHERNEVLSIECEEELLSETHAQNKVLPIECVEELLSETSSQHTCHLCNRAFKKLRFLKSHLNRHKANSGRLLPKETVSSQHTCHICNRPFKKLKYLKIHLKPNSGRLVADKKTGNSCEICHKSFEYPCELRDHALTHTRERQYSCPECAKSFTSKWAVTTHLRIHTKEKPYECPYCPLRFHTNANISRHISMHEGVKREECDICGKSIRKSDMKKHQLTHSTEKPHKCDVCEKRFIDTKSLREHRRRHTGEKPLKCRYCEQNFSKSSMLVAHLRTHLGDNVHRCKLCPLLFRLASERHVHFASHKNDDEETRERNIKALNEEEAKLVAVARGEQTLK